MPDLPFETEEDTPDTTPRVATKEKGPMDDQEFNALVAGIIADSVVFTDTELTPDRAKATEYYLGKPFGNEEDGRSQVVLTELRDQAHGLLPDLLRLFFGGERVVELKPRRADDVDLAAQQTDYIQYLFAEKNPGFMLTREVLLDGFIRKMGVFKYWFAPEDHECSYPLSGLTEQEVEYYGAQPNAKIDDVRRMEPGSYSAAPGPDGQTVPRFTATLTVQKRGGCARIVSLPPEEFLYTREARTVDDALCVAHRREMTRSELIELGIDPAVIDAHGGEDASLVMNEERIARRETESTATTRDPQAGVANTKILYVEAYPRIDKNGDGQAELLCVRTIGPAYHVIDAKPAPRRPFAAFVPFPEPHTMLGQGLYDLTADLQRIKSYVLRSTLDSLSLALYPRVGYLEGQVSIEDLLNNAIGAPIRMRQPNAMQEIAHDFVGKEAFPVLAYMDDVAERRTGRNKATLGIDADALQSTDKDAAQQAIDAGKAQAEMIARVFAEMTLKPLFKGLYELICENQQQEEVIRLRGKWVNVNPAVWDAAADVEVNVALGTSFTSKKIATLMATAAKQEEILTQMGPNNPLVTVSMYRETLAQILELQGLKDTTRYFQVVPPNWQPPQQQPQQSPEQMLAQAQIQIEQMKTQRELEIKQAELTLKQRQQDLDHEIELKKMAMDHSLRLYAIDAQFKSDYTEQQLQKDSASEVAWLDHAGNVAEMAHSQALAERKQAVAEQAQAHEQQLAEQQQAHDQQLAQQQAAAAASEPNSGE